MYVNYNDNFLTKCYKIVAIKITIFITTFELKIFWKLLNSYLFILIINLNAILTYLSCYRSSRNGCNLLPTICGSFFNIYNFQADCIQYWKCKYMFILWHLVYIRFAPLWWCRCGILCYFEECHFVRCHDSAWILSGRRSQRHLALASS